MLRKSVIMRYMENEPRAFFKHALGNVVINFER